MLSRFDVNRSNGACSVEFSSGWWQVVENVSVGPSGGILKGELVVGRRSRFGRYVEQEER